VSLRRTLIASLAALWFATPVAALEVHVKSVRADSSSVEAILEIHDLLPAKLERLLNDGTVLHLRVQAELWQVRPVWDRLVYPAIVKVFRLARAPSGSEVTMTDPSGVEQTYPRLPGAMPLTLALGDASRIEDGAEYYVHAVATIGTIADRDIDQMGDAVFGREEDSGSLGALGRLVFRKVLEIGDYLQSVSAETRGKRVSASAIRGR
jgi:hypothetical protein